MAPQNALWLTLCRENGWAEAPGGGGGKGGGCSPRPLVLNPLLKVTKFRRK